MLAPKRSRFLCLAAISSWWHRTTTYSCFLPWLIVRPTRVSASECEARTKEIKDKMGQWCLKKRVFHLQFLVPLLLGLRSWLDDIVSLVRERLIITRLGQKIKARHLALMLLFCCDRRRTESWIVVLPSASAAVISHSCSYQEPERDQESNCQF